MNKNTEYFCLESSEAPWGDYGDVLLHGFAPENKKGAINIERSGPFVPPISFPSGVIVVIDSLKSKLEESELTGFTFKPTEKKCIVNINWHEWDQNSHLPDYHPDSGEPEDYIYADQHSSDTAGQMPELWVLTIEKIASVTRERSIVEGKDELALVLATTQDYDFVASEDVGYIYISKKAKNWLEKSVQAWISTTPSKTV